MNRGALVMLVQVFTFIMFFCFQNPQYWLAPHLLLTKVYVNTFCASQLPPFSTLLPLTIN